MRIEGDLVGRRCIEGAWPIGPCRSCVRRFTNMYHSLHFEHITFLIQIVSVTIRPNIAVTSTFCFEKETGERQRRECKTKRQGKAIAGRQPEKSF